MKTEWLLMLIKTKSILVISKRIENGLHLCKSCNLDFVLDDTAIEQVEHFKQSY
jgi:hypothetical protein